MKEIFNTNNVESISPDHDINDGIVKISAKKRGAHIQDPATVRDAIFEEFDHPVVIAGSDMHILDTYGDTTKILTRYSEDVYKLCEAVHPDLVSPLQNVAKGVSQNGVKQRSPYVSLYARQEEIFVRVIAQPSRSNPEHLIFIFEILDAAALALLAVNKLDVSKEEDEPVTFPASKDQTNTPEPIPVQHQFCFHGLLENSVDYLFILDEKGYVKYASPGVCKLFGGDQKRLKGENIKVFVHEHDRESMESQLQAASHTSNKKLEVRKRLALSGGQLIWVGGRISNLLHLPGVNGLVFNFRDITSWKKVEEDLNIERNLLRTLIDHIPDIVFVTDTDSRYMICNKAALHSVGIENEQEMVGKTALDIFGPAAKSLLDDNKRIVETGEPVINREHPMFIREERKMGWAQSTVVPFKNTNGDIDGLVGITMNITEKKEAETRLQKSFEQLDVVANRMATILNTLPANVALLDGEGKVVEYNKGWKNFAIQNNLPVKFYEIGTNHIDAVEAMHGKDGEEIAQNLRRIFKGKMKRFSGEYKMDPQGRNWVRILAEPIREEQEFGAVIMYIDITPMKEAEAKIKYVNERFTLASRATNDAIWDWDLVNDEIKWGEGFERIFGHKVEEKPQPISTWSDKIYPGDLSRIIKGIYGTINNPLTNVWEDEYRFIKHNGEIAQVFDRGYIVYDENKKPVRMVGAMSDITDHKRSEAEKVRMIDDLMQRNKDLEQFAYITSHNLRAPVSNIIALSKLLKDKNRAQEHKEVFINSIHDSVTRLDSVINDLNQILKVKKEITDNKTMVAFSDIVEDASDSLHGLIKKEGAVIETDFSAVSEMLTLKSYLYSIFHNLISNSIKYRKADEPPLLCIRSFRPQNERIVLTFSDNGLGIDLEKKREQIFGLYKRFHNHAEGKGMGLFMVKTQVETLGGKISVDSEINNGTKFTIEFPD